ncbi:uncharacterized protein [Drosophila pseudoobscura]|uniref:MD-2-related lipid-recognition domain-containing protein n=1 Tax=Drosophila pseudoobscura pseudoobscura TaxID=46245 RepID=A0A6I8W232_DROPS|nr:uncharacterized protein LOC6900330 [Drosophila pseudoobscura]
MKDQLVFFSLMLSILLLKELEPIEGRVFKVTKMDCRTLDPSFAHVKNCNVVHSEHGRAALYIHITMLYKGPIDDIILNLGIYKILKNRRFQFVNETMDFCSFLRQPLQSGFFGFLINPLLKITNINTTCPLQVRSWISLGGNNYQYTYKKQQQDYIFNGFPIDEGTLKEVPLPNGVYMLQLRTSMLKKWRTDIKVYSTRVEKY